MLSPHFSRTYGDKLQHQHSGIISVMPVGCCVVAARCDRTRSRYLILKIKPTSLLRAEESDGKMARASIVARG